jgi:hypothetical protein
LPVPRRGPGRLPPLVGTRFQVLFHSPSGVLFTVPSRYLFTIGHGRVFSLTRWDLADSRRVVGARRYLGTIATEGHRLSPTGLSPSMARRSRRLSARRALCNSAPDRPHQAAIAPLHRRHNGWRLSRAVRFGLFRFRSPLLTESLGYFLFLAVLRCFNSRGSLPAAYAFNGGIQWGCPIRESPGLELFAPTRGLSQLTTPFIAFPCQGIHHVPFVACRKPSRCSNDSI